ncbi:MAG: pseudouridine synthase, partial [Eubacteriales bacterium]
RGGRVAVDGAVMRDPSVKIDEACAAVTVDGQRVHWSKYKYVMLNKPAGYVSTTDDDPKSVMKLLPPEFSRLGMFPCGRLDIDTVGLLLVTNDGPTAHELLAPKHHREKTYAFTCLPLTLEMKRKLENGVELSDFTSKPCTVSLDDARHGRITVTEGKYHQIKRMFHAVGSEITFLERLTFAGLTLDQALARGQWRELTEEEIDCLVSRG